jgi:hypothetical protein
MPAPGGSGRVVLRRINGTDVHVELLGVSTDIELLPSEWAPEVDAVLTS